MWMLKALGAMDELGPNGSAGSVNGGSQLNDQGIHFLKEQHGSLPTKMFFLGYDRLVFRSVCLLGECWFFFFLIRMK